MDIPPIIGFSGKIASGKTTTAAAVMNLLYHDYGLNYLRISFGSALRDEVDEILDYAHHMEYDPGTRLDTYTRIRDVDKNVVDTVVHTLRKHSNPRRAAMQLWGTSVRRGNNNNYWVDRVFDSIPACNPMVIVDDVRFVNEAERIHSVGGVLVRLEVNPAVQKHRLSSTRGKNYDNSVLTHVSETELDTYPFFDLVVDNNHTGAHPAQATVDGLFSSR